MFSRVRVISGMLALLTCLAMHAALAQTTWYVATNGHDTTHSGTNGWADAFLTINKAVVSAQSGHVVWVGPGEYLLTAAISIPADKDIDLVGVAGREMTIINGNHPAYAIRGIYAQNGRIRGFTITNCALNANHGGGAYLINAVMSNCTVSGNQCNYYGGGVRVDGAGVLVDSIIRGNRVVNSGGGGVALFLGGEVRNSHIEKNFSPDAGGGIYLNAGLVADCVVSGNTAGTIGGGLSVVGASPLSFNIVRDTIICDNVASSTLNRAGGGIAMSTNNVIRNCLVYGNRAPNGGGGGVVMLHEGLMENCTVVGNNAATEGGGLYTHWSAFPGYVMYARNSIVYSNAAPIGPNWSGLNTQYTWFTNSCITNLVMPQGSGIVTGDPRFVNPGAQNYRLTHGSPCINAGLNQSWMTNALDLDGRPRLDRFSGRVDMGCHEYLAPGTMIKVR